MRIIVPIVVSENIIYRKSIAYNEQGLNFKNPLEYILESIGEVVLKKEIKADVILKPKHFRINIKEK
jgi:hypothetical protein